MCLLLGPILTLLLDQFLGGTSQRGRGERDALGDKGDKNVFKISIMKLLAINPNELKMSAVRRLIGKLLEAREVVKASPPGHESAVSYFRVSQEYSRINSETRYLGRNHPRLSQTASSSDYRLLIK